MAIRFKLALTAPNHTVIETWNIVIDKEASIGDEYDITRHLARACLISEIRQECERVEQSEKERAGKVVDVEDVCPNCHLPILGHKPCGSFAQILKNRKARE